MAPPPTLTHTWFGDTGRSLFGALHLPASGRVRGAVVICPSVGKEQGDTTRGQRLLAERLASAGLAVLRYDHLHTGESWGRQTDPEAAGRLVHGLEQAVDYVRRAGATEVAVVGHRVGSLIAAQLDPATLGSLRAVVLWDPVLKGSSWLRAERSLYRIAFDDPSEVGDIVHLTGASWHAGSVAVLAGLAVDTHMVTMVAGPVAVATSDPTAGGAARLAAAGATILPIPDQVPFVKPDSFLVDLPVSTVSTLAGWIEEVMGADEQPFQPVLRTVAVVSEPGDPVDVHTTLLRTSSGIVCWTTAPADQPVTRTLVTQATANDIRTGPARLWVETARDVATHGVKTIRHDRCGVGESGAVDADDDYAPIHSQASVADASEVLAQCCQGGPTVHAGVCSGGWVAARLAVAEPAGSSLVLVNQLMWRLRPQHFSRKDLAGLGVSADEPGRPGTLQQWRHRAQPFVSATLPHWAWVSLGHSGIAQVPQVLLQELARVGIDTSLVFAATDHQLFLRQRGGRTLGLLRRRHRWQPEVTVTLGGDHAALHWRVRQAALEACRDALGITQTSSRPHHESRALGA